MTLLLLVLVQLLRLGLPLLLAAFLLGHALRNGRPGMGLGRGELVRGHLLRSLGLGRLRLRDRLGLELLVDVAGLRFRVHPESASTFMVCTIQGSCLKRQER